MVSLNESGRAWEVHLGRGNCDVNAYLLVISYEARAVNDLLEISANDVSAAKRRAVPALSMKSHLASSCSCVLADRAA